MLATLSSVVEFPIWDTSTASAKRMSADIVRQVTRNPSNVTATGTDQAGATTLGNFELHIVDVVGPGAGTKFQTIASSTGSTVRLIRNHGDNVLNVYPPSGGKINKLSTNAPIPVEPDTTVQFQSISTVDWITVP